MYWTPARDPPRLDDVSVAYLIITALTIGANAWATAVDLAQPRWLLATMAEAGVPRSWLPPLAVLKGAGAAGLLAGLLGLHPLGIAAGTGLVLFFGGAIITHVRARVFRTIAVPGTYFALAAASAALAIAAR